MLLNACLIYLSYVPFTYLRAIFSLIVGFVNKVARVPTIVDRWVCISIHILYSHTYASRCMYVMFVFQQEVFFRLNASLVRLCWARRFSISLLPVFGCSFVLPRCEGALVPSRWWFTVVSGSGNIILADYRAVPSWVLYTHMAPSSSIYLSVYMCTSSLSRAGFPVT